MKKIALVLVLLFVAWVAGFWPERGRHKELQAESQRLAHELEECQRRARVAALLARLLDVRDAVAAKNYGIAQGLASPFFDAAREEAGRAAGTPFQGALEGISRMRDSVTAALTRGDASVEEMVRGMEMRLRSALGGSPVAAPVASASPAALAPGTPAAPSPAASSPPSPTTGATPPG